jgi:hypothetical protein
LKIKNRIQKAKLGVFFLNGINGLYFGIKDNSIFNLQDRITRLTVPSQKEADKEYQKETLGYEGIRIFFFILVVIVHGLH